VEDDPRARKLVGDVLQFKGYTTVEAETAEHGIQIAQEARPALIIMDIRLPGMDGMAAVRELRADARTHRIPVIAMTASVTYNEQKFTAAGFSGYHAKPINVSRFLETVRTALRSEEATA
ncbi:MAG: response regulator, partial [Acidimicrobiia bacterium]